VQLWIRQRNFKDGTPTARSVLVVRVENDGAQTSSPPGRRVDGVFRLTNLRARSTTVALFPAVRGDDACLRRLYTGSAEGV